jgi:predicted DNA-binding transcriptional regulator AlpA
MNDMMDDDRLLSPRAASAMSGDLSASTMRRLVTAGQYPRPVVLSRTRGGKPARIAYSAREVATWVARKIAADRAFGPGAA